MTQINKKPSCPPQAMKAYPRPGTKYFNVLEHFRLEGNLNKFEALSLGETCLSATIADMCNDFNLEVPRRTEKAINGAGYHSTVTRYKLTTEDTIKLNAVKLRGSNE